MPPGEDRIVTLSVLDPVHAGGAVWYSNPSGAIDGPVDGVEWIYSEEVYGGDIESLCSGTPVSIYLPFATSYHCLRPRVADVTLVIDVSTSMRRDGGAGRSKLAAVQAAASAFIDRMNLRPGHPGSNRVALVAFNRTAWTEQELTDNTAALGAALDRLPAAVEEYTRLDLALEAGGRALGDAGEGTSDRERVLVLLTDALPNGVPLDPDSGTMEGTVLRAAEAVKRTGVRVYTIGVGRPDAPDPVDRINRELLRAVATSPDMAYEAADAEAVAGIYEEIALRLACR